MSYLWRFRPKSALSAPPQGTAPAVRAPGWRPGSPVPRAKCQDAPARASAVRLHWDHPWERWRCWVGWSQKLKWVSWVSWLVEVACWSGLKWLEVGWSWVWLKLLISWSGLKLKLSFVEVENKVGWWIVVSSKLAQCNSRYFRAKKVSRFSWPLRIKSACSPGWQATSEHQLAMLVGGYNHGSLVAYNG